MWHNPYRVTASVSMLQRTMVRHMTRLHGSTGRRFTTFESVKHSTISHLQRHGYAVQDDVLGTSELRGLRSEVEHLITAGLSCPNKTHVISGGASRTYEKSGVLQSELQTLPARELVNVPRLHGLHTDGGLAGLISVLFPRMTLREQFVKAQRAKADAGCFPVHVDSAGAGDARVVTGLLYVHDEWGRGDGGALRVYDTPVSSVDITPRPGRLVLLSACGMHHRVMPARRARYAVTVWLCGQLRAAETAGVRGCLETRVGYEMVTRGLRDAAVRVVRSTEWVQSLRESHEGHVAEEVVAEFEKSLLEIRRIVPRVICARPGFEDVGVAEVEEIVGDADRLRRGLEKVEQACGGIPFLW